MTDNDPRLAELGAEQYQDELEALERIRTGMQTEDDYKLMCRIVGHKPQEHRNDR